MTDSPSPEDAVLLVTDHELMAFLAMNPTDSAQATRDLFRLSTVEDRQVLERAGVTTLLARGMATVEDEDIVPVDKGAFIAAILTSATDWLEVALVTPKVDHVMFVAASEHGAILLSLNRLGAHEVRPVDASEGLGRLGMLLASTYLLDGPDGLPASAMVTNHHSTAGSLTAHLKRNEDESWEMLVGAGEANIPVPVTAEDAFVKFLAAITPAAA